MIKILLLIALISVDSFILKTNFKKSMVLFAKIHNKRENPDDMDEYLNRELEKLLKQVPVFPEKEEDIKEDTMESFLRDEFNILSKRTDEINFSTYYIWRKLMGTFLTYDEILEIFNEVTDYKKTCNLMQFIKINRIIDENS